MTDERREMGCVCEGCGGVAPPPFFDETERGEGDIIRRRAGPPAAAPVFCFCLGGRGGGGLCRTGWR